MCRPCLNTAHVYKEDDWLVPDVRSQWLALEKLGKAPLLLYADGGGGGGIPFNAQAGRYLNKNWRCDRCDKRACWNRLNPVSIVYSAYRCMSQRRSLGSQIHFLNSEWP
jgi:hypothetical protein